MAEEYVKITKKFYNDSLNFLPFNRKYKVRKDLIESMNKYGWIVDAILVRTDLFGEEKIFVADGQNRIATAMYLGITPKAKIIDGNFEEVKDLVYFVAGLNTTQKPWRTLDYVKNYAFLNIQDYIELLKITNSNPYSVNTNATMLYGYRSQRGGASIKIREGVFKINQKENTLQTLEYAAKLSKHVSMTSRMVLALHYVSSLNGFDFDKFEKQYIKNAECVKELKLDDYTDVFSSWLN